MVGMLAKNSNFCQLKLPIYSKLPQSLSFTQLQVVLAIEWIFRELGYHNVYCFQGEYIYGPESEEAAATIKKLTHSFCREYKLNQNNINAGKSGILIGR